MCQLSYLDTQTSKSCFVFHRCKYLTQIKDVMNHVFHQVLVVGGPERWVWPAGESEGGVPAGARQQCMIISLLLWSGFCLGPSRPWPLTSSHSQTTIRLRWSPNNPSISLLFIRLRPLLRSASERWKQNAGERRREDDCWWSEMKQIMKWLTGLYSKNTKTL